MMTLTILGSFLSFLFFMFKDLDVNIKYLIIVIILDFVTGIFKAFIKHKISSQINMKGILKKVSYFVIVAISIIIGNILKIGDTLKNIVVYSLILNEMISTLENCSEMGVKLPKILISSLEVFQKRINDENEKNLKIKD